MYIGLHVKYRLFLSRINETSIFLDGFSKNTEMSNFMKIRTVGVELTRTDRRTEMTKLLAAFHNFGKKSENACFIREILLILSSNPAIV